MNRELETILNYLNEERGFDFSGYRQSMIERRLEKRFRPTKCENYNEYGRYLQKHPDEFDNLIDVLTINVSRFFRDTLTFEYIAGKVLPEIVHRKTETKDRSLRVWSAGCSMGEEPYSIAILISELFEKEKLDLHVHIFATDIDGAILKKAQKGIYAFESIQNVKYRLLKKYFTIEKDAFTLLPEIKELVTFLPYDMLDKRSYVPPESVFGSFDLVFCRNVLIYFTTEYQDIIFDKLYRSLTQNGYLILGEVEIPSQRFQRYFTKDNEFCHIYHRI